MIWSLIGPILAVYAGLCGLLFVMQRRLVYLPSAELAATPHEAGLDYEEIWLAASDGVRLHGWFLPAPGARRAVLFFHGNAGNIGDRIESLAIFRRLGLAALIIDYRGYGRSDGRTDEPGTYRDARAAWDHITGERGFAPSEVVLFGRSLGGGIAARLATEVRCGALIMESTFTSLPDLGARIYPWFPVRLLARIRYDSLARLSQVDCPVLVVHSRDDEVVPFEHAVALLRATPGPKRLLEIRGAHGNGFVLTGEAYVGGLRDFLESLPPVRRVGAPTAVAAAAAPPG